MIRFYSIILLVVGVLFTAACGKSGREDAVASEAKKQATDEVPVHDGKYPVYQADAARVLKELDTHKGSVIVLNMWATWCEPCVEEFPDLVNLHKKYHDDGLVVIGVSHDFEERVSMDLLPFLEKHDADFIHFLQNGQTSQDFIDGIDPIWSGVLPATLIYDRKGNRVDYISGMFDTAELEKRIIELLSN